MLLSLLLWHICTKSFAHLLLVSIVANASSGLAVDSNKDNTIVNGNLYYFVSENAAFFHCLNQRTAFFSSQLIFSLSIKLCFLVRAGPALSPPFF